MKTALPVGLVRGSVTLVVLALLFCAPVHISLAETPAQAAAKAQKQREKNARREAKKHEVKPHPAARHPAVAHAKEHPEAHAKEHEAAAKKRRSQDRKRASKAEANAKKPHPAALKTRSNPLPAHRDENAKDAAPGVLPPARPTSASGDAGHPETDTEAANRVHAWEESQKKSAPVPTRRDEAAMYGAQESLHPTPDSSDAGKPAANPEKAAGAAESGSDSGASTGVSHPPPDSPQAALSKQTDLAGAIRRSAPKLEPTEDMAAQPVILPALYTRRGRLVVPRPLKGSHEILVRQNQMADDEGLDRIRDDEDLQRMRQAGLLVPVPASSRLHIDERLPANRRYCRPWAAVFLTEMGREFHARFGDALQVNSAVRTVAFQQRLIHTNGNAAPAEGDSASPHLTGQAVDIAKHGLSLAEIAWMRAYLLPLVQAGKVDVEEEFQQSCFHISVYKSYLRRPVS
jgi:hypothetical protein